MIKQFFKKVLISYLIIICCIYTPTAQAANWSFGGFNFGNGSLNITKDGVRITTAAVDSAPITSNLGKKILGGALRGASVLNAISIIAELGGLAVDWVLDPANNAVTYSTRADDTDCYFNTNYAQDFGMINGKRYTAQQIATAMGLNYVRVSGGKIYTSSGTIGVAYCKDNSKSGSIPIDRVAQKIYENARLGDAASQADVASAVSELVNAGAYNTPINQAIQDAINNGTLPKDTGTNTNTNNPTNPQVDTSSITAAIQSLASSFASAISNAFNGITSVINTSIDKLLNKQDQMQGELVNVGSKVDSVGGQVVGVGEDVKDVGGKVVGVQDAVKDVGGKVVGLNDSVDKVGDKVVGVGDKVTTVGDKVGTKVDSVGDKVTTVGDTVGTKVDSVGEKVTTVGEKVTTSIKDSTKEVTSSNEKVTEAVKESTKEITQTIKESKPKDFELPAFCSWASKVCDFIDWVKTPNEDMLDEPVDVQSPMPEMESTDISFGGQCPQNFDIDIDLFGKPVKFTLFDSNMFCQFLSDWIRIPVIFSASLVAVYILGGRRSD